MAANQGAAKTSKKPEPVEDRPGRLVPCDPVGDPAGVDAPLREDRPRQRGDGQRSSSISAVRMLVSRRQTKRSQPQASRSVG